MKRVTDHNNIINSIELYKIYSPFKQTLSHTNIRYTRRAQESAHEWSRTAGHGRTKTAGQAAAVARSDWSAIPRHTIPDTPLADPRSRDRVADLTCARLAVP